MINSFAKDTVKVASSGLFLLMTCLSAFTLTYTDTDNYRLYLSATGLDPNGESAPKSASGHFYIGNVEAFKALDTDGLNIFGFDTSSEYITDATVSFAFDFGNGVNESVEILLATGLFGTVVQFGFFNGAVNGTALFDLDEDGLLTYTVTALSGDAIFRRAQLIANTAPGSRPVPDAGSSLFLLGIGAIGLGYMARRQTV